MTFLPKQKGKKGWVGRTRMPCPQSPHTSPLLLFSCGASYVVRIPQGASVAACASSLAPHCPSGTCQLPEAECPQGRRC